MTAVEAAYAARADEYADALGSMNAVHPSDKQLVDTWASRLSGRVLDAGCGPGHWTDYLHRRGLDMHGIDITPRFIDRARASHPSVPFELCSIDAIDEPDASFGGVLSWFSTIHHKPPEIGIPFLEFARVLHHGGTLVLGYFDGPKTEPFDHAVVRAYRWSMRELSAVLETAGFDIIETHRRTERGHRDVGAILCERRAR